MKLINQLKNRVVHHWHESQKKGTFYHAILNGTAKTENYTTFIENAHFLVQHTPIHLKIAQAEAEKKGQKQLAEFFKLKLIEESGHDKWAEADLEVVKSMKDYKVRQNPQIEPAMRNMVETIEKVIRQDPYLYLAYIFLAEYMTVIAGPALVDGIENKCGFPKKSMTIVENHAELDKDHVDEWEEVFTAIVDEKKYAQGFLDTVDKCYACYHNYLCALERSKKDAA